MNLSNKGITSHEIVMQPVEITDDEKERDPLLDDSHARRYEQRSFFMHIAPKKFLNHNLQIIEGKESA
jgi:hypothetical protein